MELRILQIRFEQTRELAPSTPSTGGGVNECKVKLPARGSISSRRSDP